MSEKEPLHRRIARLGVDEILEVVKGARYRNRRCVEAFLERCQVETERSPQHALPLLLQAPEYVERCRGSLAGHEADYRVRAFAVLGTGLTMAGSFTMARQSFQTGQEVRDADPLEVAALKCRRAAMEVTMGRWELGLSLSDQAVQAFQADDGRERDDRSLAFALAYRGVVRSVAFHRGASLNPDDSIKDFMDALACAKTFKRTRLAAVAGLGATAVTMWFAGRPTRFADPISVVNGMTRLRKNLREEGVPCRSVVDAKARWILGLAMFKLLGQLSDCSEAHLDGARSVLAEIGSPLDAVQLTVDKQWCLLEEGRWAKALAEWSVIEERLEELPDDWKLTMVTWGEHLRRRALDEEMTRNLFEKVRGIRGVGLPGTASAGAGIPAGW